MSTLRNEIIDVIAHSYLSEAGRYRQIEAIVIRDDRERTNEAREATVLLRDAMVQLLDNRIDDLKTYRLARNTYVPAIVAELVRLKKIITEAPVPPLA